MSEVLVRDTNICEMQRKLREYFEAGVKLVWLVNPEPRTVAVYTSPDPCEILHEGHALDAGAVLPGFVVPLRGLFSELDRQRTPPPHRQDP